MNPFLENLTEDEVKLLLSKAKDGDVLFLSAEYVTQGDVSYLRQCVRKHTGKKITVAASTGVTSLDLLEASEARAILERILKGD
jgi:NDP-sugar pyrophosphorylase family protein